MPKQKTLSLLGPILTCATIIPACVTGPQNLQEITIGTQANAIQVKVFDILNQPLIEANITAQQRAETEIASNKGIVIVRCIGYKSDAAPNQIIFACNPIWTTTRDTVHYPNQPFDALGYPIAAFGFKMDKDSEELPSSLKNPSNIPFTLNCIQVSFSNLNSQPSVSLHTCLTR